MVGIVEGIKKKAQDLADNAAAYNEARDSWKKIYGTDGPWDSGILTKHLAPIGVLKNILYPNSELPIDANRQPTVRILAENPEATTKLNAYLTTHHEFKKLISEKFANAGKTVTKEELLKIAQDVVADPDHLEKLDALLTPANNAIQAPPEPAKVISNTATPAAPATPALSKADEDYVSHTLTALGAKQSALDVRQVSGVEFKDEGANPIAHIKLPDGSTHHFKRVAVNDVNQSPTQLKAAVWQETKEDGKAIGGKTASWVTFPGYDGQPNDGSAQTKALKAVGEGKLNPQTPEAVKFFNANFASLDPNKISVVHIGAGSLGASVAEATYLAASSKGIPSTATLFEPEMLTGPKGAVANITAALQDPKSDLSEAMGPVKPEVLAAFQTEQNNPNSEKISSIRAIDVHKDGVGYFSNSAMLQMGVVEDVNLTTAVNGREGAVDPNNDMVGKRSLIDLTSRENKANGTGEHDRLHAIVNTVDAMHKGIQAESFDAYKTETAETAINSEKDKKNAALQAVLNETPIFKGIIEPVIANAMTGQKSATEENKAGAKDLSDLTASIFDNPQIIKPLAKQVESSPAAQQAFRDELSKPELTSDPAKLAASMRSLLEISKTDGLLNKVAQLSNNLHDFTEAHTALTGLKALNDKLSQNSSDLSQFNTPEKTAALSAKLDKFGQVLSVFKADDNSVKYPHTARLFDELIEKYVNSPNFNLSGADDPNSLIGQLTNPAKLETFAQNLEPELEDDDIRGLVNAAVSSYDPSKPGAENSATVKMFLGLYNDPTSLATAARMVKSPDALKLLSGNFKPQDIMSNPLEFIKHNPDLFNGLADPAILKLLDNDEFRKSNPSLYAVLKSGIIQTTAPYLQAFGVIPKPPEDPNHPKEKTMMDYVADIMHGGDVLTAIMGLVALFMGGSDTAGLAANVAGQAQAQTQTRAAS